MRCTHTFPMLAILVAATITQGATVTPYTENFSGFSTGLIDTPGTDFGWDNTIGAGVNVNASFQVAGTGSDGGSVNGSLFTVAPGTTRIAIEMLMRVRSVAPQNSIAWFYTGNSTASVDAGFQWGTNNAAGGAWIFRNAAFGSSTAVANPGTGDDQVSTTAHRWFDVRIEYDSTTDTARFLVNRRTDGTAAGDGSWTVVHTATGASIGMTPTMQNPASWTGLGLRTPSASSIFDDIIVTYANASNGNVFRLDFERANATVTTTAGQVGWDVTPVNADANQKSIVLPAAPGVMATLTAGGTLGEIQARGGFSSGDSRSTAITGTSWNDMVEDLIVATGGDGTLSLDLTGLTIGQTYELTGWHNDSYTINNGFAAGFYNISASILSGATLLLADMGQATNLINGAHTDSQFDTSFLRFTATSTSVSILYAASSGTNLVLNGLQLDAVPTPVPVPVPAALPTGLALLAAAMVRGRSRR